MSPSLQVHTFSLHDVSFLAKNNLKWILYCQNLMTQGCEIDKLKYYNEVSTKSTNRNMEL